MMPRPAPLAPLIVATIVLGACQATPPTPTALPSPMPTLAAIEVPTMSPLPPTGGQPVVCWYGSVHRLPEGGPYDDYVALLPEEVGEIGLRGATQEAEAAIAALRDREEPAFAHFWGTVYCDVPDVGGCQLVVERLRPDEEGPPSEPQPVEGWEGVVESFSEEEPAAGGEGDDYFVLAGDFPVRFGITSGDPDIAAQLEARRDTRLPTSIWGQITCGVDDAYGTQIEVTRIE